MYQEELIQEIVNAHPKNEAEVETKILLNIFKLLDFSYIDRADKPNVVMHFGRERKTKIADFILYNGADRTVVNALVAVEAKRIGESLDDAVSQVISYVAWAGTPYYMACNGIEILVSKYNPTMSSSEKILVKIEDIKEEFQRLYDFSNKALLILNNERLSYIATYFPDIEKLPPAEFFQEYLKKFSDRFSFYKQEETSIPLQSKDEKIIDLPVHIDYEKIRYDEDGLLEWTFEEGASILITGEAGSGKTTFFRRIGTKVNAYIRDKSDFIPIFITVHNEIPSDVYGAFKIATKQLGVRTFEMLFKRNLKKSKAIIFIDGFDEVFNHKEGEKNLKLLLEDDNLFALIVTSRTFILNDADLLKNMKQATISKLTMTEVEEVLNHYNIDKSNIEKYNHFDVYSPIQLLMYVRLQLESFLSTDLTTFDLYYKYIDIVMRYFNDSEEVKVNDSIKVMYDVSQIISSSKQNEKEVNLNTILSLLDSTKQKSFIALIKSGILTTSNEEIGFFHKSFEEFAIASYLLEIINKIDIEKIREIDISSDNVYALTKDKLDNIDNLLEVLGNSNNRVRKRAIGIIKYSDDIMKKEDVKQKILEIYYHENTTKVKNTLLRLLLKYCNTNEILNILTRSDVKLKRKQNTILELMRVDEFNFKNEELERESLHEFDGVSFWLLYIAISRGNVNDYLEWLPEMILDEESHNRGLIFSLATKKANRNECERLIWKIYEVANNGKEIIRMLYQDKNSINTYDDSINKIIVDKIINTRNLKLKDYNKLKKILKLNVMKSDYEMEIKEFISSKGY